MIRRLLTLGCLLGSVTPVVGLQAQGPEPVLIDLRLGRITGRTVQAFRSDEAALIPLQAFFDLAEMRSRRETDGTLVALFQPGNREFRVYLRRASISVDGAERPLRTGEYLANEDDVFLSTAVLGDVLDLQWEVSWTDLLVTVVDPSDLPIARRLRREAFAPGRLAGEIVAPADGQLRETRYPVEGLVVDYNFLVPTQPGPKQGAYAMGLGLFVLGGSLEARAQSQGEFSTGTLRYDLSWTGVWRTNPYLSQLRLGDGFSSGPRTRALTGIALGNVPFRRPQILGELPFRESLGPGWQVEAYRGGRLIAFDSVNALGQFAIDVPIQYGENPVDFIAYGPFGEVRQFNRTYRVNPNAIPAGRIEYGVSLGACRGTAPCTANGNADLRYGLSTRWTVGGGVDRFWRDTLPDLTHPYLSLTGSLTNAFQLEAEYVADAVARGVVRFEPSVYFLLEAEAARFDTTARAPILTIDGRARQYTLFGQIRPFAGRLRNWFLLDASYDITESRADQARSLRLGASLQPGQVRLIPSLRWRETTPQGGGASSSELLWGLNVISLPIRQLGPVLGRLTSRAGIDMRSPGGVESWSAFVSYPVARNVRLELGGFKTRGTPAALTVFFAADLASLRAYTTVQRSPTGDWTATQQVQGSVLYDAPYRKVTLAAGPSIQQGGVSGRVFLDLNDNGRMDTGEPVLPGVQVTVGIYSQRSNARGEFRLWQFPAFDPVAAAVDTTTLASPLWLPTYGSIRVDPQPNRFSTLNIPILPGGMAEGIVTRETTRGPQPVAGAALVFRHLGTGRTQDVSTFSDGSFYEMNLRPGTWEVRVDPQVEERLGLRAEPVRFIIRPRANGEAVGGIVLRLR